MRRPTAPYRPLRPCVPSWECVEDHDFGRYVLRLRVILADGTAYNHSTSIPFGLWDSLKPRDRVGWLEYRVTGMLSKLPTRH